MQYLAICQSCRSPFALAVRMDVAKCPKPDCSGVATVSDGTFGGAFQVLHQVYPMAMSRDQRREISKLLRKLASGKITAEQALGDASLSQETKSLLEALAKFGFPALTLILMLFTLWQNQMQHEENREDQAQANEDQRRFLETLASNLEYLHQNDAMLADRLSRVGAARIVEIEQEQAQAPQRRRVENGTAPKPQRRTPQATQKKKKGKKRS